MKNLADGQPRPVALSIAGFDPSSGAGMTADLKVFAAFDLYGMSCITALTVQSTQGVRSIEPVSPATVSATLNMLSEDVTFSGIKLGMLADRNICEAVAKFLEASPETLVVLDPVFRSSSGRELLEPAGVSFLRERLLRQVDWVTPNLEELSVLSGISVSKAEDVPPAAARLQDLASNSRRERLNVLVTGGHLDRPNDFLLTGDGEAEWISGDRVQTNSTHGTGCALSSALLCRLILGDAPFTAASRAKDYVTAALQSAYPVGKGKGPMNHLFNCNFRDSAPRS
ncbi:Hydroxymethylpyrimidine phosphate kinase ThiD [Acidisarcina polymorpha]|uniref:hydroxymethylpyrimidine kinase n=1 Tax=Acidisarcina polymorpha TaxID=2211140 RepID=A0A2Z5G7I3_9BACT|nr:bifunctional hydroxymethylpyrimidine kinase/phosphomethylpyrimidine kinase [Acidisarcina polymorpha]AXC14625.1 Hydroxymethylpyrimidine phosphate kinase ThiD [Acidisarcina polymorpha]